jgi:DNA-binding CsgD family transcriptional regulator
MRFDDLSARVSSCASFAGIVSRVLEPIARTIGASNSILMQCQRLPDGEWLFQRRAHLGTQPELFDFYPGFEQHDPLFKLMAQWVGSLRSPRVERVIWGRQLPLWSHLKRTRHYRRYLSQFDFGHLLGIVAPVDLTTENFLALGFFRGRAEAEFHNDDALLMQKLTGAVGHLLRDLAYEEEISLLRAANAAWARGQDAFALFLISAEGRVRYASCDPSEIGLSLPAVAHQARQWLARGDGEPKVMCLPANLAQEAGQGRILRAWFCGDTLALTVEWRQTEDSRALHHPANAHLTPQQHAVLTQLCSGAGNAQIAAELEISVNTVVNHLHAIYGKLGVSTRAQAVALALRGTPLGRLH